MYKIAFDFKLNVFVSSMNQTSEPEIQMLVGITLLFSIA